MLRGGRGDVGCEHRGRLRCCPPGSPDAARSLSRESSRPSSWNVSASPSTPGRLSPRAFRGGPQFLQARDSLSSTLAFQRPSRGHRSPQRCAGSSSHRGAVVATREHVLELWDFRRCGALGRAYAFPWPAVPVGPVLVKSSNRPSHRIATVASSKPG